MDYVMNKDTQTSGKQIYLFIGASSVITKAIAEQYAIMGHHIILAGRNTDDMMITAKHLTLLGATSATAIPLDLQNFDNHQDFFQKISELHGQYDKSLLNIFVLSSIMPSQSDIDKNPILGIDCVTIGLTGIISVLQRFMAFFEQEKQGSVTIFGSVAGDRGRLKNYVYGATKAGLECYASGLRNQLGRFGVHVMLVKPGFMNTPMIEGMKLPPLPIAQPKDVAYSVVESLDKKRNVIYVPWFWRIIMGIIQHIPEFIFKKMSF
jgi:short-subunit dehydrogenase